MLHREDVWKIGLALVAVAGSISSHTLTLPASLLPYHGEIEFICSAIVIGAAVYINKPGSHGGQ